MNKERRLGRGLEALLGRPADSYAPREASVGGAASSPASGPVEAGLVNVSVYEIDRNPYQPRRDFDDAEIGSLADSIQEHGLLQPIVVRRQGERYQLVAGERRLRAAIKAGLGEVAVQVRNVDDRLAAEIAIVENLQRKDLNALEKGASFHEYLERYGCTQEELAKRLKIDRSTVANLIRLLELPDDVQSALRTGAISQGHARALLALDNEREQVAFCTRIQREGLSVRSVEDLVQQTVQAADAPQPLRLVTGEPESRPARKSRSQHLASLEQQFRAALGAKVDIRESAKGRGRIVIHFKSHEEFDRLQEYLCDGGHGAQSQVG
ncbi:MAG TPA: ParB/RepB/Spo0J family partition protein [Pirellulales bacterium]|nr:ParB/RepB/Spo0J family partition protein [Pirellulales bacterium]